MWSRLAAARWACSHFSRRKAQEHLKTTSFGSSFSTESAPPIRVGITESAGRGVFATRKIGSGEIIHTARPIVSHPSLNSSVVHNGVCCYFCLRKCHNNNCSEDYAASFCSQHCQQQAAKLFYDVENKADWSRFNQYCRLQGLKYPLLVKRLACQVISGVLSSDAIHILQPEPSSSQRISLMNQEVALLRNTLEDTDIAPEQMTFLSEEWYAGVLARIRVNAFRIELAAGGGSYEDLLSSAAALVEAEAAVGNAVYMLPSFYNHDCDPNVNIVWIENVDAKIKALRDIEEGEELRICYIDASMDYDARQRILYEGFGFRCNCPRCVSKD